MWGITQPFVGMFADRYGSRYVMLIGVLVYILGLVTMIFSTTALAFTFGAGICVGIALSCTASSHEHDGIGARGVCGQAQRHHGRDFRRRIDRSGDRIGRWPRP